MHFGFKFFTKLDGIILSRSMIEDQRYLYRRSLCIQSSCVISRRLRGTVFVCSVGSIVYGVRVGLFVYGLRVQSYTSRSLCIRDRIWSSCVISVRLFVYGLRVRSYTSRSLYRRDPYGLRCTTLRSVRSSVYDVAIRTVFGVQCRDPYGLRCTVFGVRSSVYRSDRYGLRCAVAINTSLCFTVAIVYGLRV